MPNKLIDYRTPSRRRNVDIQYEYIIIKLDKKLQILTWLVLMMLAIHIVNSILQGRLGEFGVLPGEMRSLPYIITAPFIHGSWAHLLSNLVGLVIFSGLCLLRGIPFYLKSSLLIILLTGILVWLFGRQAVHIGASGWIFGLWSLSIAMAWFQRRFGNILIALFVIVFYGGMIFGVLPSDPNVSFESHLFGALSGVICAYMMTKKPFRRRAAVK